MAKFERTKPHVNVGTIGCVDNRKTLLTAALAKVARLESATTPAEVGEAAISDALAAYLGHGGKFALWTSDQTEAMRAAMQVGCATLARQLAYSEEANATLKTMCAAAEAHAEQAESQLAEATRRLGEVEADARRWRTLMACDELRSGNGTLLFKRQAGHETYVRAVDRKQSA